MFLAFDTSTPWMTMFLGDPAAVRFHLTVFASQHHSRQLMAGLEQLKRDGLLEREVLKGIVVGRGPGSFTGVKIAVMTAMSLSYSLECEVYGYSSLEGMASLVPIEYLEAMGYQKVVPVIVHKRNEIFWSECGLSFRTGEMSKPLVGSVEDCLQANRGTRSLVVCPWPEIANALGQGGLDLYPTSLSVPDARSLVVLHDWRVPSHPGREGVAGMVPIYGSQVFSR